MTEADDRAVERLKHSKAKALETLFADGIFIEANREIEGGTSGCPILNLAGELVAIVSNSSVPMPGMKSTGLCPRPLKALPEWICEKVQGRQRRRRAPEQPSQQQESINLGQNHNMGI
jgi:hypothetical protein